MSWSGLRGLNIALSYGLPLIPWLWATSLIATLNQMHWPPKWPLPKLDPTKGQPQLKGVVLRTFICKPKKPNSANCKCCCIQLSTGCEAICFISAEGHSLQEQHVVLVQGGCTQDLPGVKLKVVHGEYDCGHVQKKK
ncbi:28S ribosomal protein S12, mitochondrial-like [Myotis myotis]|uniref:28S ribosomal protein S12, mitochondrial-like n=1 Tax=Myotis myotis TaxID=51298 RepID=UPI00174BAE22|nr:28S ribosomal protein S12, mitochondrial-like [Myotis myotis]